MNITRVLRQASFRGARFEVVTDDKSGGRRLQVHEYPQRDKPYAEDMGRSKRTFSITGFVVGPLFMVERNLLVAALEKPGPGTLYHPLYGGLQVVVEKYTVSHDKDEARMCRIEMSFIEAGELAFPLGILSSAVALIAAADFSSLTMREAFSALFSVAAANGFVAQAAEKALGEIATTFGVSLGVGSFASEALPLLLVPVALAALPGQKIKGMNKIPPLMHLLDELPAETPEAKTVPGRQIAFNRKLLLTLVRHEALAQAARLAAQTTWTVHEDAMRIKKDLAAALDAEMENTDDDTLFRALQELRLALIADIDRRAQILPRLGKIKLPESLPALALAYDLYEDAGRADEIVVRNRIRHPGFLLTSPLLVSAS